jgi:hypothetical protein
MDLMFNDEPKHFVHLAKTVKTKSLQTWNVSEVTVRGQYSNFQVYYFWSQAERSWQ